MITQNQFESWQNIGTQQGSINSHESIRNVLSNSSKLKNINFDIFLQGSYKNHTNIRGDSDVDIVIKLSNVFSCNISDEKRRSLGYPDAVYDFFKFKYDIISEFNNYYGIDNINVGNKSIKINFNNSNHVPADVLVCNDYWYFNSDNTIIKKGICFYTKSTNQKIINYPKEHFENGNKKSDITNGNFKKYVRLIKNARNYINEHLIPPSFTAPSYFLESLIYNLDNRLFFLEPKVFLNEVIDIWEYHDQSFLLCQNEISPLFGYLDTYWIHHDKIQFAAALNNLLRN